MINISEMCQLDEADLKELFNNWTMEGIINITYSEFRINRNDLCAGVSLEWLVSWIVPVVFALVCIVGFFGNLLVIIVVIFYQQMRNTTNILILNLATADLLFIVICIPPTAIDYAIGWPLGDQCCKIIQYLIYATTYGSVYTLVLLSLDRYLAVVYPVKSISLRTQLNTTFAITATWLFTIITCIPIYIFHGTKVISSKGRSQDRTICTFDRESYNETLFQSVVFVTMLALPLLAILWLYMNMLLRLWRGSAATHGPGPSRDTRNKCKGKENKMRVTRMIVVVIIVFALCWTPLQIVLLLKSYGIYDIQISGLVVLQIITQCLAYCNSCLNPILYAFFSPNFRSAFRAISGGGKNPPQFNGAKNNGGTIGSNQPNNNASSRRLNRKIEIDSNDISRQPTDGLELKPVQPEANQLKPTGNNNLENQTKNDSKAFGQVSNSMVLLPSANDRPSGHDVGRRQSVSLGEEDIKPRKCFAVAQVESCSNVRATIQDRHNHL